MRGAKLTRFLTGKTAQCPALEVVKIPMDRPSWHDELIREAIVCGQIKFFQSQEASGSDKVIRVLGASLEIKDSQHIFRLEMSRAHGVHTPRGIVDKAP